MRADPRIADESSEDITSVENERPGHHTSVTSLRAPRWSLQQPPATSADHAQRHVPRPDQPQLLREHAQRSRVETGTNHMALLGAGDYAWKARALPTPPT